MKKYEGPNQEKYEQLGEVPIQIWCADMWAVLWNAWMRGFNTIVHNEMDFSFATYKVVDFDIKPIFHLAGVTGNETDAHGPHFNKRVYENNIPFNDDFSWVNKQSASSRYIEYFKKFKSK